MAPHRNQRPSRHALLRGILQVVRDFVQHPHDKLVRAVFSDVEEAALFLRHHLPVALAERLECSTLAPVETSFVNEGLRESESDFAG